MVSLKTSLFYDDFLIGDTYESKSRTITQSDVDAFTALTSDHNPIHANEKIMKSHPLGKPVVHGMLVASIGIGLIAQLKLTHGTLVAMVEQEIRYKNPIYVGDTVHAKMEVIDKRETRSPSRGIIKYRFDIITDQNVTVVVGQNTNLVFTKKHPTIYGE